MNIYEKSLVIKRVDFFDKLDEENLLVIADALEERIVNQGDCILQKGGLGDTMFIIASGRVKVHDGDKLIKELAEFEVFGELAAIAPEKRIASITAIEESLLLQLDHRTLDELMIANPLLCKSIILFLCGRMRSTVKESSTNGNS